ncbi:hypothetical protein LIMHP_03875 [Leptospira interrogans serovar Manilae]|nr:hypothetical protein LIMLP_03890 [Leptospira interrogans serovar Manilae]AKP28958.1 hypothetical protein LIMHP_03875 [Leptospira interrogans serovar Manilae]EYU63511.1 hypothetical protein CI00_13700 [Leptospira interrogans serovar Manilae]
MKFFMMKGHCLNRFYLEEKNHENNTGQLNIIKPFKKELFSFYTSFLSKPIDNLLCLVVY